MLEARVYSAKVPYEDRVRLPLDLARDRHMRLSRLWVDAGYQGRRRRWTDELLGVSVKVVRKSRKPLPEKAAKEGTEVDCQKLMPPRRFRVLPRRWVVERTFVWIISHNRRMAKDYERSCAAGEAFAYAAMTRLMVRWSPVRKSFQTVSPGASVNSWAGGPRKSLPLGRGRQWLAKYLLRLVSPRVR